MQLQIQIQIQIEIQRRIHVHIQIWIQKNIKYQKYFGAGGIYQAPHLDNGNLATNVSNSPLSGSLPGPSIWVDFTPKSRKKKKTWQDKPVFPPERDT